MANPTKALWSGRFATSPDEAMMRFSTSLPVDGRLWRYDLRGSRAHAAMLGQCGIIAPGEAAAIVAGLHAVEANLAAGSLTLEDAADEDIHSFVERVLTERIGAVAGKLHTARSRNDQVALDVRLYMLDALATVRAEIAALQRALLDCSEEQFETVLPGYTHLQRAQPVLLAHHLLAYFWMLARDSERLAQIGVRADVLPLGAAALAGTTFAIDREAVARELGFARVSMNSMDTVADRDSLIESVGALALTGLHLSRLAEEIVLWSTPEFGFCTPDDRFATGSSIMPQKRNPDSMELVRGKSARVVGDLVSLLTLVKALPLTYNRDLQEDKEPLFDAFDTVLASLQITRGVICTLKFHPERMDAAAGGGFSTATDVADYLVRQGVPFREAHEIVGRAVRTCEENGQALTDLSLAQWQKLDARFEGGVLTVVTVASSVAARTSAGGTAPVRVREQLAAARALLGA